MHSAKRTGRQTRKQRRGVSRYTKTVIRWLIFCFPAGLLMMWSDRCRWSRGLKSCISIGIAALVVAVVLPQTLPPERAKGGVEIVSLNPVADVQGPRQQAEGAAEDLYIPNYIQPTSLIVQPTPTPIPVYVYCNDGGKYYHAKGCRYVKNTSARVTLTRALDAGYSACAKCNPPKER